MSTSPRDCLVDRLADHVADYSFSDGEVRISVEEAVSLWLQEYAEHCDLDFDDVLDEADFQAVEVDLVSACGQAALCGGREICQGVRCRRE